MVANACSAHVNVAICLCLTATTVPVYLQLIALGAMHRIPWYKPTIGTPDLRTYKAPETTVIYLINLAQFVILGVVFNKGYPHRWAAATHGSSTHCTCLLLLLPR
jgi:hypothetical protein